MGDKSLPELEVAMLRWIAVLKLTAALVLGLGAAGTMTACSTIEGVGKDISALGRAGKRAFD